MVQVPSARYSITPEAMLPAMPRASTSCFLVSPIATEAAAAAPIVVEGRVTELTDWRRQVREHRQELIVGAAIVGFAVGGLMALRRRR